jgi:surface protein
MRYLLLFLPLVCLSQSVSITKVIETDCTTPFLTTVELYVSGTVDFSAGNAKLELMRSGGAWRDDFFDLTQLGVITDSYIYIVRDIDLMQADFPSITFDSSNTIVTSTSTNGDDGYRFVMSSVVVSQFGKDNTDADNDPAADWNHGDTVFSRKIGQVDDGTWNSSQWTWLAENSLDNEGVCLRSNGSSGATTFEDFFASLGDGHPLQSWTPPGPDTESPIITINGSTNISVNIGTTYTDAGATAMDNRDGDITASIIATSTVDTNAFGTYTVTYNVSDAAGNAANPAVRTVNVSDLEAPIISLLGENPVSVTQDATYIDPGATAFDNVDGDITANIILTNTVESSTPGTYTVTYNVSDAAGNVANPVVRTVNVNPKTPITNTNFHTAVDTCLSTNPIDGMCSYSEYGAMPDWDVSQVTDMSNAFRTYYSFNGDLSAWDVSNVTYMTRMFFGVTAFNGDLSSWDVSNVIDMVQMFDNARSFNGNLSSWNVSNVTNMGFMFQFAFSFNGDISSWDVSSVTGMRFMFFRASNFNQNISSWCVTNISSEPFNFSSSSPLIESNKPVWGTCPTASVGDQNQLFVSIYPNPTTSIVTLQGDKEYDIEVYTLQGKKVMTLTGNTIDMSHLSSATYIVKATDKSNNEELTYKVVKN